MPPRVTQLNLPPARSPKESSMNDTPSADLTRRDMIATTGKIAAASALAGLAIPAVHAAGDDLVRVALIGCGGRGGGAAENALRTKGQTQLHAMADVFED